MCARCSESVCVCILKNCLNLFQLPGRYHRTVLISLTLLQPHNIFETLPFLLTYFVKLSELGNITTLMCSAVSSLYGVINYV